MWPQLVVLFLYAASIGIDAERHGKSKTGTHSVWTTVTAFIIHGILLYFGGLWDVFLD